MTEITLKVCVAGPCKTGKTLLCRALAEQPLLLHEYNPTAAVRVQEFARGLGVDRVKVQLWDCSGNVQYQPYWNTLSRDLDGIILVIDPTKADQERELESLYMNFAQPHSLAIKQCLVLAITIVTEAAHGLATFAGLQGKLNKLNQHHISLNPASPAAGIQDVASALDKLLMGCLQNKKDRVERQVMNEEQQGPADE